MTKSTPVPGVKAVDLGMEEEEKTQAGMGPVMRPEPGPVRKDAPPPRKGTATPREGAVAPRKGATTPAYGMTPPRKGTATPAKGMPRQREGTVTQRFMAIATRSAAGIGPLRSMATTLDALVSACREDHQEMAFDLAGRTLDLWRRQGKVRLRLEGSWLLAEGEVLLGTTSGEGPWIVPAYMAGLREIALLPHCNEVEMVQLGEALARARPDLDAIAALEGWLWADGAEGFAVRLGDALSGGERVALEDPVKRLRDLSKRRVEAAEELEGLAIKAAATVSGIYSAARDELQRPMEKLAREAAKGSLKPDTEVMEQLRDAVRDPLFWADSEMDAALSYEVLRAALPPNRLARRTVALMSRSADLAMLDLLGQLAEHADPYARSFKKSLEAGALGEALARDIKLDDEAMAKLQAILDVTDLAQVASALVTGLLERSRGEREVAEALLKLIMGVGLDSVWKHVRLGSLSAEAAAVVCWLLFRVKAHTRYLSDLVSGLGPEAAMEVLAQLPDDKLWPLNPRIRKLLGRAPGSLRHDLIVMLLKREEPRWAKLMGDALKETRGSGWQQRSVALLGEALTQRKLGRSYLVPMVRDNDVPPEVRVTLIDVLQRVGSPKALREATKFGVRELLFPSEVREALRNARQQKGKEGDA